MRIALGADHAGFPLKEILVEELRSLGDEVVDYGTHSDASCDYPDIAIPLARDVAAGGFDFGVLICSNGVGPSIVANKQHGIRAALCHDVFSSRRAREHADANVLCMGAWAIGRGTASEVLRAFRVATFEGGRHARRVAKVRAFDDATRTDGARAGAVGAPQEAAATGVEA